MKELILALDDELHTALEAEAKTTGCRVQDVVVRALRQWQTDAEVDAEGLAELSEVRREWQEKGGVGAKAFFERLRREESDIDG